MSPRLGIQAAAGFCRAAAGSVIWRNRAGLQIPPQREVHPAGGSASLPPDGVALRESASEVGLSQEVRLL